MSAPRGHDQGGSQRELKVEDALLYLDEVKKEFQYKPEIYNEFLDIMKNFKAQTIDTPGVIKKVSDLFRGYRRLILGFNTFLPEGHKINNEDIERSENEYRLAEEARMRQMGIHHPQMHAAAGGLGAGGAAARGGAGSQHLPQQSGGGSFASQQQHQPAGSQHQGPQLASGSQQGQSGGAAPPQPPSSSQQPPPAAAPSAHQPQEFDHAISYVTNIKQRFANEPDTYKAFLDILHDYQRDQSKPKEQQKGIQEVLDKVSKLFADHPDLLKEFTYFLPDAVQGQAKERLDRAAHESYQRQQMRQQMARNRETQQARRGGGAAGGSGRGGGRGGGGGHDDSFRRGGGAGGRGGGRGGGPYQFAYRGGQGQDNEDEDNEFAGKRGGGAQQQQRGGGGGAGGRGGNKKARSGSHGLEGLQATSVERFFFEKVKDALGVNVWGEFVQALHLYNSGVLEQADLLTLVGELLLAVATGAGSGAGGDSSSSVGEDLFDEFKVILSFHATAQFANQMWAQLPLSELDLSQCRRCTPSYRALPESYPALTCSKRTELEKACLNDGWVGVPNGSEEQYVFKHMRKNQFEEELFKCEDERFEIDMVVESNKATIHKLQPMVEEINKLKEQAEAAASKEGGKAGSAASSLSRYRFRMDERSLSSVHLAAIARVYGDHAEDMFRLLKQHPLGAIPVIHRRLEQKDAEWRRTRQDQAREWRPLVEANFVRALDHRRDAFKARDKRLSTPLFLVAECLDAALALVAKSGGQRGDAAAALLSNSKSGSAAAAEESAADLASKMALVRGLKDLDEYSEPPQRKAEEDEAAAAGSSSSSSSGSGSGSRGDLLKCVPHLVFDIGDVLLQWEMFKLIKLALPRSSVSNADTQRILSLWREVVVDFLGLPFAMLDQGTATTAASGGSGSGGGGDSGSSGDAGELPLSQTQNQTGLGVDLEELLPGTSCVCPGGPATVEEYNQSTATYTVSVLSTSKSASFHARTVWPLAFPVPTCPPAPLEPERRGKQAPRNGGEVATAAAAAATATAAVAAAAASEGEAAAAAAAAADVPGGDASAAAEAAAGTPPPLPAAAAATAAATADAPPIVEVDSLSSSDYPEPTTACPSLPESSRMLLLTTNGFLFFRLYALLYERLVVARATVEAAAEAALSVEEHPLKADVREEQVDMKERALDALSAPLPPVPVPSSSSEEGVADADPATADTDTQSPPAGNATNTTDVDKDSKAADDAPSGAMSDDPSSSEADAVAAPSAAAAASPASAAGGSSRDRAKDEETKALVKGGFRGFLGLLGELLSGTVDAGKYDDACRAMCGSEGYLMSTLEKNVMAVVKALQGLVHDKACAPLVGLYQWERQGRRLNPKRYLMHAKHLLRASASAEVYRVQVDLLAAPEGGERSRTLSLDTLGAANKGDAVAISPAPVVAAVVPAAAAAPPAAATEAPTATPAASSEKEAIPASAEATPDTSAATATTEVETTATDAETPSPESSEVAPSPSGDSAEATEGSAEMKDDRD